MCSWFRSWRYWTFSLAPAFTTFLGHAVLSSSVLNKSTLVLLDDHTLLLFAFALSSRWATSRKSAHTFLLNFSTISGVYRLTCIKSSWKVCTCIAFPWSENRISRTTATTATTTTKDVCGRFIFDFICKSKRGTCKESKQGKQDQNRVLHREYLSLTLDTSTEEILRRPRYLKVTWDGSCVEERVCVPPFL